MHFLWLPGVTVTAQKCRFYGGFADYCDLLALRHRTAFPTLVATAWRQGVLMPVIKLSRKAIAGLEGGMYYDATLKGFGLRIGANGAGTWFAEYRPGEGGRKVLKKRVSLGRTNFMSPEEAREAATGLLATVHLGADPAAAKAKEKAAAPFSEVAGSYVTDHVRTKRKAATADYYDYVLRLHVNPHIGAIRTSRITAADVNAMHAAVGRKGGPYIANRALAVVSAVFNWFDKQGQNPAKGVEKFREEGRERYLATEELNSIGEALREAETVGLPFAESEAKHVSKHARKPENRRSIMSVHATNAIRLLLLTGCRLREILNLQWSQVDIERGLLFLPDSKTGRKTVVLSSAALEVIAATPKLGAYVIASESAATENEKARADLKAPWKAICRHTGLTGVRIHDLRHTFASFGAGSGLGLPVIGKLLGHASSKTTERYAHVASDASRRAADSIANQIGQAMGVKS